MNGVELVTAAALGAASGFHCLGMCGPLVVASCSRRRIERGSAAAYFVGRTLSYALGGAVAGAVGHPLVKSGLSREVKIGIGLAIAVVLVGNALRWLRSPAAPGQRPVALGRAPRGPTLVERVARYLPTRGLGLGLVTGLFPCGALLGGLLAAAATGTAGSGAASMIVFALASAPALLLALVVGDRAASWLSARSVSAKRAIGVVILAVGCSLAAVPWLASAATDQPPSCGH